MDENPYQPPAANLRPRSSPLSLVALVRWILNHLAKMLSIAFLIALVVSLVIEAAYRVVPFESYISTFLSWAVIFALIGSSTRRKPEEQNGAL